MAYIDLMAKRFLVGFYNVAGVPDSVETPCTGRGRADYDRLWRAITIKHFKVAPIDIVRLGTTIELRHEGGPDVKPVPPGSTLQQLFGTDRTSREVGHVYFSGDPAKVVLTFNRSEGYVGLMLLPRIKTSSIIRFSNKINGMRLASELSSIIGEVLGSDAQKLTLNI